MKLNDVVIWFRESSAENGEIESASKYFNCINSRCKIKKGQLVIPRYSALPFFKEQAYDIQDVIGAKLINNVKNHNYIANLSNWYYDLKDYTPQTWFRLEDIPNEENGPFVLKGETNSRKFDWRTHMFAKDRKTVDEVYWNLCKDALIISSEQNICIRKFEELLTIEKGINGIPHSHEFRFFVAYGKIIDSAFYWGDAISDYSLIPSYDDSAINLVHQIINIIGDKSNFYAVDIARKNNGEWILIELNDGMMSGLCGQSCPKGMGHDADKLYENLNIVMSNI